MRVAVTGVSGYLGGLVAKALDGDSRVDAILGLDIASPRFEARKMRFEKADVLTADFPTLFQDVDAVIHLAFIVTPPRKLSMDHVDRINIDGSRRVFEGAVCAGIKKIVYASSVGAYGAHPDNPAVLTENSLLRPNPNWYYSRTKGEVERLLDDLESRHPDVRVIRLRPSILLGANTNNPISELLKGKILVSTRPDVQFGFCWDEDVAKAFELALFYPHSDTFNITSTGGMTIGAIGELTKKKVLVFNHRVAMVVLRAAYALGIISRGLYEWLEVGTEGSVIISNNKAIEKLGWQPSCDGAETVLRFIEAQHR